MALVQRPFLRRARLTSEFLVLEFAAMSQKTSQRTDSVATERAATSRPQSGAWHSHVRTLARAGICEVQETAKATRDHVDVAALLARQSLDTATLLQRCHEKKLMLANAMLVTNVGSAEPRNRIAGLVDPNGVPIASYRLSDVDEAGGR